MGYLLNLLHHIAILSYRMLKLPYFQIFYVIVIEITNMRVILFYCRSFQTFQQVKNLKRFENMYNPIKARILKNVFCGRGQFEPHSFIFQEELI